MMRTNIQGRGRTLAKTLLALLLASAGCQSTGDTLSTRRKPKTPVLDVSSSAYEQIIQGQFVPSNTAGPAFGLSASDGTGLRVVAVRARAVLEDPLAFTEMRLVFENPQPRTLEGTFRITLPQGASVSRFAMRIENQWQEGEVVEKQAARQAYEDFLHRRQDPALLEQAAGNEFSARVFPIPANGRKEVVISFSHELRGDEGYALPLGGLPEIEDLDVEVYRESQKQPLARLSEKRFAPRGDYVLARSLLGRSEGVRSGDLSIARVTVPGDASPDALGGMFLLVDTSASRAAGFEREIAVVRELAKRVALQGTHVPIVVAAFDQDVEVIYEGPAAGFGDEAVQKLIARGALGASDLEAALHWVYQNGGRAGGNARRLVLLTDGVATAGESDNTVLAKETATLSKAGFERLDVIGLGGIRDEERLGRLVSSGLSRDGVVIDGALDMAAIARKLERKTVTGMRVDVPGALRFVPSMLKGLQVGDEALVYAEVNSGAPLQIVLGEQTLAPSLREITRPLVERAWAKTRIASLLAQDAEGTEKERIKQEVIALSTNHRVLSPYTSLLVLETEDDYKRFHIDRNALTDILTVEGGRVSKLERGKSAMPAQIAAGAPEANRAERSDGVRETATAAPTATAAATIAPPAPPLASAAPPLQAAPPSATAEAEPPSAVGNMWGNSVGDSFGAGGLGLAGTGSGGGGGTTGLGSPGTSGTGSSTGAGFGSGHGRLGGSHRSNAPSVRQGATSVSGRIPPEVIQRIVRQNFGRFRMCYENGLRNNPNLQGRVAVRFVITRDGSVSTAQNAGSDLPDQGVIACVVRSFMGLAFPQPENGIVSVTYPIMFSPDGGGGGGPSGPWPGPRTITAPPRDNIEKPAVATPYTGPYKEIQDLLAGARTNEALVKAKAWVAQYPGDMMGWTALGEAYLASGAKGLAARAFGSLIDLFPARADFRRYAGARLSALGDAALGIALDSFEKAREERPDHPSSHRLFAMALVRAAHYADAFAVLEEGTHRSYPPGRFLGVEQILGEDLGLVAAAWIKAEPQRKAEIEARLKQAGGIAENEPSLRFVINWETDGNDLDFHIFDEKSRHAFYARKTLQTEQDGLLYADVRTGYGPECFTIRKPKALRSAKYKLQAHYFSRGPMGYGMGNLEVIEHDGKGNLSFFERPFVVMEDRAYIDLAEVGRDGKEIVMKQR